MAGALAAPQGLFDDGPETAAPGPEPVTFRSFDDVHGQRKQIYDNALRGARAIKPVENTRFRIDVVDPRYDGDYTPGIAEEKQAILGGRSLKRALKGKVRLTDKTSGQVVDEQDTTLAHVPHLNSRGLFINNGTVWSVRNQQRLRPGVYVLRQQNGNVKAQFNVKPGTGRQFNLEMDPESGVFKMAVGQSGVRLYPLLREMGIDDDRIKRAWGPELFAKNWRPKSGNDQRELDKVIQRLGRTSERQEPTAETLKKILDRSELDEETTGATLGKEHAASKISLSTLMRTTEKILARARDEVDDDNRDGQQFQSFHSAEDFFEERLRNDRPKAMQKLLWNATKNGKLGTIPSGLLNKGVHSIFNGSGLVQAVEDVNPLETLDQRQMVTRLGEGGISSNQSVARSTRGVQPSYFGLIDPIRAPEGQNIGVDMRVTDHALKGSDNKLYLPLRDVRTGKVTPMTAKDAAEIPIAFPGEFERSKRTGMTTVRVMKGEHIRVMPIAEVSHELPSGQGLFSRLSNMVPMIQGSKAQRSLMGARMLSQALPLQDAEAPLVQSVNAEGLSQYAENARHAGAVIAKEGGRVVSTSPDHIDVVYQGGRKERHELYNNYPLARKCVSGDTRILIRRGGLINGLAIQDYQFQAGDETLSVSKDTGVVQWAPVTGYQRLSCDKKMYRVQTRSGLHVDVTEDHSLVTLGDRGLVKVLPGEVKPGKTYLPGPRRFSLPTIPLPAPLSKLSPLEAGQLVGLYLAEGSIANLHCLSIAATEDDITEFVQRVSTQMGLHSRVDRSVNDKGWTYGGVYIGVSLELHAFIERTCGHGSYTKFVSPELLQYGPAFAVGLLGGYLSGDGCVCDRTCDAASRSVRLRDGLQMIAASIGISTCIRQAIVEGAPAYYIRIRNESVPHINQGWVLLRKRQGAKTLNTSRAFDRVPLGTKAIKREYYNTLSHKPKGVNFHHVDNGCAPADACHGSAWLMSWVKHLWWEEVCAVTPIGSPEFVYDLSVGDSTFYANGLFVHNTMLHSEALVRPGDPVKPGQALAKSNFTDGKGILAPGRNMRVAYMVGEGGTYEDGFVISESAAKKLTSQHHYKFELEKDDNTHSTKLADFRALYPDKFTPAQLQNFDEDGCIKEGTTVHPDDPLILSINKRPQKPGGILTKSPRSQFIDGSQIWDNTTPGVVTDVVKTKNGIKVSVKSTEPMTVGSKLSARYGNKGVVAAVRPDGEMPHDSQGRPMEVLVNALGVITRGNPAVLAETLLGKVARKTGQPYHIKPFEHDDLLEFALGEAHKHGVDETDTLTDPKTGREIPGIFTGHQFMMRLHHTAEAKMGARDSGGYGYDDTPARGGEDGCFVANQKILTDQGSVEIGHLCEKRLGLSVLTWSDPQQDWVYRPVTDWFVRRAMAEDILTVTYMGPASDRSVFKKGSAHSVRTVFAATKNHIVYTFNRGPVPAGSLTLEDSLVVRGPVPTYEQASALIGSLLGDSSITPSENSFIFQCEHSLKQVEFVNWKQSLWAGLGSRWHDGFHAEGTIQKRKKVAVKSRAVTWCTADLYLAELHAKFYGTGRKEVSAEIAAQINEHALAVWLLDDGWITNVAKKAGQVRLGGGFSTDSFSEESVDRLIGRLGEITGCTFGKTRLAAGFRITFSVNASEYFIKLVACLVPADVIPGSKKFLKARVAAIQTVHPVVKWDVANRLQRVPAKILSVAPYRHDKPGVTEVPVYDITVADTHAYCAGSALVSNSKRIAVLDTHSLLSYGATEVLKDAKLVRGQRNDEYWRNLKLGVTPQAPQESGSHRGFLDMLRSAGINVRDRGGRKQVLPITDADVDALARHEIENSGTYNFESMQPIAGGLFDMARTGGPDGRHFAKITLPVKIPNPIMEEPIIRMLGLTKKGFEEILGGRGELYGKTGPEAIESALKNLKVDREIENRVQDVKSGSKSNRDDAVRALNYLTGLKTMGIKPEDLMISKIPVLPPKMRPVMRTGKLDIVNDANYLYHDLMEAKKNMHEAQEAFGSSGDEYLTMYNAAKAVTGLGDPVSPKHQEQGIKGILAHAIGVGASPKYGRFQRKVIGQSVDNVGRGTITPDPELDIDQVSVPEDMAWTLFKPFIIRRLVRNGFQARDAVTAVKEKKPAAMREMLAEMKERPVYWNRAPSLHRYNYVGAWARLSKGNNIGLPQATEPGANADHDGDNVNVHIPVGGDAVKDVLDKMMPSKNLWHPGTYDVHLKPDKDYLAGLYLATTMKADKEPRRFATRADAYRAYMRGEVGIADPVIITELEDQPSKDR